MQQIDIWVNAGIIRRSSSNFASRTAIVKKKDGSNRVCVNYYQLNKMVLKDCFPVPIVENVLEKLENSKIFTIMDLENGFFHVPVEESSKKYTAFITKEGLFEFNSTPLSFCNSPAVFIRFIGHVFQNLINENILDLYMDDIVIHAETADECLGKLKKVLDPAAEYGLKMKWKKCRFLQSSITFLRHLVGGGEIKSRPEKTKAIRKFSMPQNMKAVQSFL